MEWRTIDSAPKDGSKVDLWVQFKDNDREGSFEEKRWADCKWDGEYWVNIDNLSPEDYVGSVIVTHWMPLPNPPEAS